MTIRTIIGYALAAALLTALSACVPAYYPSYPPYYARPAYPRVYPARPRSEELQRGSNWINPEPAR